MKVQLSRLTKEFQRRIALYSALRIIGILLFFFQGAMANPLCEPLFLQNQTLRSLKNIVSDFSSVVFPYSQKFMDKLSTAFHRNYSFISVEVTVPNDTDIISISEILLNTASNGKSVLTVANTEALKVASSFHDKGELLIIDISERNLDGLKFLFNETVHHRDLDSWKQTVLQFARGDLQLGGTSSKENLIKYGLTNINETGFRNIQNIVRRKGVHFIHRDLKNKGLGDDLLSNLLKNNPLGAIYVSNVPEYIFGFGNYTTEVNKFNSEIHFVNNINTLSNGQTTIIAGNNIQTVKVRNLNETNEWFESLIKH